MFTSLKRRKAGKPVVNGGAFIIGKKKVGLQENIFKGVLLFKSLLHRDGLLDT